MAKNLTAALKARKEYVTALVAQASAAMLAPPLDMAKLEALKQAEAYKVGLRIPDLVEVITGWRAWRARRMRDAWALTSLGVENVWMPKQRLEAFCRAFTITPFTIDPTPSHPHEAPSWDCQCGIWAFKELDKLVAAVSGQYQVAIIGKVSLWGRVIECENGWRAQYAYPSELWLLDNNLEELGRTYDVPVRMGLK